MRTYIFDCQEAQKQFILMASPIILAILIIIFEDIFRPSKATDDIFDL